MKGTVSGGLLSKCVNKQNKGQILVLLQSPRGLKGGCGLSMHLFAQQSAESLHYIFKTTQGMPNGFYECVEPAQTSFQRNSAFLIVIYIIICILKDTNFLRGWKGIALGLFYGDCIWFWRVPSFPPSVATGCIVLCCFSGVSSVPVCGTLRFPAGL